MVMRRGFRYVPVLVGRRAGTHYYLRALLGGALLASLAAPLQAQSVDFFVSVRSETVAITHVHVVDGTGAPPADDQTVIFEEGRITAIGPAASVPIPAGAEVVDASGQTLLPGYVALHEHTYFGDVGQATEMSRTGPALLLGYGVTTAMTAGSQLPYRELSTKREVDADRRPGPRFHISGPYIDQLWRLPFARNVTDGNEVRRVVRYWASEGVTWFKFMGRMTTDVLRAGIEEAHALGLRVGGHLCAVTFTEAAALGIDVLHHGFLMNTDYAPEKQVDECPQGYFRTYETLDLTVPPTSDSIVRLAQSGVAVVSTLAAYETFAPTRYRLPERVLVMLEPTTRRQVEERYSTRDAWGFISPTLFEQMMAWERAFVAAGGLLGAGSDPWNTGVLPGVGSVRNYGIHVEAGFDPATAIQIMTLNGARILGLDQDYGSIEIGKVADLVLVDGDPVTTPADLYDVVTVFKDGTGYDAGRLLASARGKVGLE